MSTEVKFSIHSVCFTVVLTGDELVWTAADGIEKGCVPVDKILVARQVTSGVEVIFVEHLPECIWKTKNVIFNGQEDDCAKLSCDIKQKIESMSQRPRRVLVLINPIGGRKQGNEIYKKTVEPLLKLAGIDTDVVVSDYSGHMVEIITGYDFKNTDGIVLMGGDGTYFECMDTLIKRTQEESNINYHDPNIQLKQLDIPVALIPTGTGNGVSVTSFGTQDIETAVLHVITGTQKRFNMLSLHNDGRLLAFPGCIICYGVFSDMLRQSDRRRILGIYRQFLSAFNLLVFNKPRHMEAEIQCIYGKSTGDENEMTEHNKNDKSSDFEIIKGNFTNIVGFSTDFDDVVVPSKFTSDGSSKTVKLCLYRSFSRYQIARHFYRLFTYAGNCFIDDFIERKNVTGFKVKLLTEGIFTENKEENEAACIAIDGELLRLTHPEFEIRLQSNLALVYASK